jgi:hypothetical protein
MCNNMIDYCTELFRDNDLYLPRHVGDGLDSRLNPIVAQGQGTWSCDQALLSISGKREHEDTPGENKEDV